MAFHYHRVIRIQDTDSTGVIYFADLQKIALEAFEEFLHRHKFNLQDMVAKRGYLLPIVHAEADYKKGVFLADSLDVHLTLEKLGTSSISLKSVFTHELTKEKVGDVSIVHVVMCKSTRKSIPIPEELKQVLDLLKD